jgi:hypothetical protein
MAVQQPLLAVKIAHPADAPKLADRCSFRWLHVDCSHLSSEGTHHTAIKRVNHLSLPLIHVGQRCRGSVLTYSSSGSGNVVIVGVARQTVFFKARHGPVGVGDFVDLGG